MANTILDIPRTVYGALRALVTAAGLASVIRGDDDVERIDLHGLTVRSIGGPENSDIVVSSLLSSRTKDGRVELSLNGELTQMDLDKAREVVSMLQRAIEAAVSDQMIYQFLTEKIGLEADQASRALIDFRELRQGSRSIVYPH